MHEQSEEKVGVGLVSQGSHRGAFSACETRRILLPPIVQNFYELELTRAFCSTFQVNDLSFYMMRLSKQF